MAFAVNQRCQQSIIRRFLSEQEPSSMKSLRTSSSSPSLISGKDGIVEEFFAAVPERPVKFSESPCIGHSMGSEQMLEVAPCTPLPSFPLKRTQRLEAIDTSPSPPSLCLSVGSPSSQRGRRSSDRSTIKDMASSLQPSFQTLSARLSLNGTESSDIVLSGLRPEDGHTRARGLSLGFITTEMQNSGSQSFVDVLVSGEASNAHLSEEKGWGCNELLAKLNRQVVKAIHQNALAADRRLPTNKASSIEQQHGENSYNSSGEHFFAARSDATVNGIFYQNHSLIHADPAAESLPSHHINVQQPSLVFSADFLSLKQDWDRLKLAEYEGHLPGFCVQKRTVAEPAADGYHINGWRSPEKRCKVHLSGGNGVEGMSIAHCNETIMQPNGVARYCNGWEPTARKEWCGPLQIPDAKANIDLSKVKLEVQWEDHITTNCKASPVMTRKNTTLVSAKEDTHVTLLEKQKTGRRTESAESSAVNKVVAADGDWGRFLALSATPTDQSEVPCEEMAPPFECRFKLLQEFLQQCDHPDRKYDLEALQILSAAEIGSRAVLLETRAVKLSLEESKELDRMKMLDVLGRSSVSIITPQGT